MAFYPNQYYPYQLPQQPQPQPSISNNPQNSIIWVQGEAGAKSYLVAPNTTVQLWDSEAQTIYLKSADSSGMPSMKIIDYTIRESQNMPRSFTGSSESDFATKNDINLLQKQLEALKGKFEALQKDEVKDNE